MQTTTNVNEEILKLDEDIERANFILERFLTVLKETTLING
jgi:hypothetical protein